jgi:HlyD family secretion protein
MPQGSCRSSFALLTGLFAVAVVAAAPPAASAADEGATGGKDGVFALGRIEPEHGIRFVGAPSMVNAVNGAVLRTLNVEAGDDVKAGQVLAETDTAVVEAGNVEIARAELEQAERQAEQAVGNEQDFCSRADVAQRTSARRSRLLKSGVTSDEEADVAAGDAKALSGSCNAARLATKAAQAAVDVARAKLARNEAEHERCLIRAPFDGRVIRIIHRTGEPLGIDGILELGNVKKMYAIAEVYETDIRRVRVGQKATVTSPAFEGSISGTVEHIRLKVRKQDTTGTDPAARKDARIVEVEVLLDKPEVVATLSNLQVDVLIRP